MQNLRISFFFCTFAADFRAFEPMKRILCMLLLLAGIACLAGTIFTSCNVTRTITNESQYFQRGDTSVLIQTKTIETYDATKKL